MQAQALYPLKLQSALHVKVWGGRRLSEQLRKELPTQEPYGESWELHETARVVNGSLRGRTLEELTRQFGADLLGEDSDPADGFPLLAKLIDANEWLSIQVHPNDEQAQGLEGEPRGKTEAWVVLWADRGARLVAGLQPGAERVQMAEAARSNRLEEMLVFAEVKAGDVLYLPANTVHALGPGILVYEIQQSSDLTYRLYDWGRLGLDGRPRELHIDKAVQVTNLNAHAKVMQPSSDLLIDGDYFRTWRHELKNDKLTIPSEGHFQALTCISGKILARADEHEPVMLAHGETGLIPANLPYFSLDGSGVILRSRQR